MGNSSRGDCAGAHSDEGEVRRYGRIKVRLSQSLVPPSIVRQTSTHVVLSWRVARGPYSIRTEEYVEPSASEEWINLEHDSHLDGRVPATTRIDQSGNYSTQKKLTVSKVQVLEVDHVELQTCACGCLQCLLGLQQKTEGEPHLAPREEHSDRGRCLSCVRCRTEAVAMTSGNACWRPVYRGAAQQCTVRLEQANNALQHFRMLVRTRNPPPKRRGYLRPTRQRVRPNVPETSIFPHAKDLQARSPQTRRRLRSEQQPGAPTVNWPDSAVELLSSLSAQDEHPCCSCGIEHCIHDSQIGRGRQTNDVDTMLDDNRCGYTAAVYDDKPPRWFVSAPVFVDSRPPAVTLNGLGTTLVLTWPPLAGFSGSECVSYILEQRSRALASGSTLGKCPAAFPQQRQISPSAASPVDGECSSKREPGRSSHGQQHARPKSAKCRRRPRPSPAVMLETESKMIFSVGTRCWFVPTLLEIGNVYRYRLRIIHERGRGIAGPWATYVASVPPPRCGDAGVEELLLSLPRMTSDHRCCASSMGYNVASNYGIENTALKTPAGTREKQDQHKHEQSPFSAQGEKSAGDKQGVLAAAQGKECTNAGISEAGNGGFKNEEANKRGNRANGLRGSEARVLVDKTEITTAWGRGTSNEENGRETPMVWYTLEGSEDLDRWEMIYKGPASEIIVKGLRPNSFCAFRVAVDVVLTELRRRALCSLTSLDLEAQRSAHAGLSDPSRDATAPSTTTNGCTNINNTNLAAATSVSFSERQSHCWSNVDRSLSKGKVLAALRLRASGFSGMYSPTTTWSSVYLPNKLNGRGKYTNSTGRRRRARWSPSASPVMSKMRREGFAVHDLAATVGGGYYLEPPPTGPLSSPVQVLRPGDGETGRERVCRGTEGGGAVGDSGVVGCLDQSQPALMATAPAAPFFVGFVSDDVQQVKVWWAAPQQIVEIDRTGGIQSSTTPIAGNPSLPLANAITSAPTPPAMAGDNGCATSNSAESCTDGKNMTPHGHDMWSSAELAQQEHPLYTLEVLDPVSGGMRLAYSGLQRWTDVPHASPTVPVEPGTAYFLRLSAKATAEQAASWASGVVLTAPPAPVLELVGGGAALSEPTALTGNVGESANGAASGGVTLRVFWVGAVDTSFFPTAIDGELDYSGASGKEYLAPSSVALEMARAWETSPTDRGAGGITRKRMVGGRASRTSVAAGHPSMLEEGGTSSLLSSGDRRNRISAGVANGDLGTVRKDAGGGLCWTLDSSNWDRHPGRTTAGAFKVVWRGFDGETEAFTPKLPPGMRFAFRVRIECRWGIAFSAATVYQTASVLPPPPRGLRASVASHESRAGRMSSCLQLSWGPPEVGHGRNVVSSFAVQARRYGSSNLDRDVNNSRAKPSPSWKEVGRCSDPSCLDPDTLGIPHIVADYRVRAEGPAGFGPWCDPLSVNLLLAKEVLSGAAGAFSGSASRRRVAETEEVATKGLGKGKSSGEIQGLPGRCPMPDHPPGSTERDSLTGELKRARTTVKTLDRSPLQVQPASPVVASIVSGSAAGTASKMTAIDLQYSRAGGSKQLLWGALVSPRAARMCLATVGGRKSGLSRRSDSIGVGFAGSTIVPNVSLDDSVPGSKNGQAEAEGRGENRAKHHTCCRPRAGKPSEGWGEGSGGRWGNGVPHALALVLREELDVLSPDSLGFAVSSNFVEPAAWRRLTGRCTVIDPDGNVTRQAQYEVATWNIRSQPKRPSSDLYLNGRIKR